MVQGWTLSLSRSEFHFGTLAGQVERDYGSLSLDIDKMIAMGDADNHLVILKAASLKRKLTLRTVEQNDEESSSLAS